MMITIIIDNIKFHHVFPWLGMHGDFLSGSYSYEFHAFSSAVRFRADSIVTYVHKFIIIVMLKYFLNLLNKNIVVTVKPLSGWYLY